MKNVKYELANITNLIEKQIANFEMLSENKTSQVMQDSNDNLHEVLKLKDTIMVEVDEEIKNVSIVAKMITNISDSSKNVNIMLEDLLESSSNIEKLVIEIQKISNETNILAFNVSIEASRAGKNGLEFSVLSKEIRKLSDQTKGVSLKIQEVVSDIQNKMKNAVETKNRGGDIVGRCTIKSEQIVQNSKIINKDMENFFETLTNILTQRNLDLDSEINRGDQVKMKKADYIGFVNGLKSIHSLSEKVINQIEIMDFKQAN